MLNEYILNLNAERNAKSKYPKIKSDSPFINPRTDMLQKIERDLQLQTERSTYNALKSKHYGDKPIYGIDPSPISNREQSKYYPFSGERSKLLDNKLIKKFESLTPKSKEEIRIPAYLPDLETFKPEPIDNKEENRILEELHKYEQENDEITRKIEQNKLDKMNARKMDKSIEPFDKVEQELMENARKIRDKLTKLNNENELNKMIYNENGRRANIIRTRNAEKLKAYTDEIQLLNSNKFNFEQSPNETDQEYLERINRYTKEVAPSEIIQDTKTIVMNELREQLEDLFNDYSITGRNRVEEIINELGDEERLELNENFGRFKKQYTEQYGSRPPRIEKLKEFIKKIIEPQTHIVISNHPVPSFQSVHFEEPIKPAPIIEEFKKSGPIIEEPESKNPEPGFVQGDGYKYKEIGVGKVELLKPNKVTLFMRKYEGVDYGYNSSGPYIKLKTISDEDNYNILLKTGFSQPELKTIRSMLKWSAISKKESKKESKGTGLFSDIDKLKNNVRIIEGEIDAGNNSPLLIKKLFQSLTKLNQKGIVSKSDIDNYLRQFKY